MFKTFDADRKMIERKYYKPDEPHDSFNRFAYHGYDYDPTTGLSDDAMNEGIATLAAELEAQTLPRPIHKARLFEYVPDNTQIDIAPHDYFIGIRAWGRLISKYTVFKWNEENKKNNPRENQICINANRSGASYGWLDFDHTVPDWDAMLELGFSGLLRRVTDSYERTKASGKLTAKQKSFYRGIEIEYNAILRFIDRLYKYAASRSHEKAPQIAACLAHLRDGAPTDSYEVLQFIYIYFMLSESVEHYQVRSLGHGLDQTLYPYFVRDIESGRYTKEEIGEFIAYFLMQWQAINNYWGQPIYLGGANPNGTTKVNELSYYILDIYDRLNLYNPKVQIKVYSSTPKDFVMKALEMVRHGNNSIVFINCDVVTKCLMARGASYEEAVDSVISGCYEYKTKGKGIGIAGVYEILVGKSDRPLSTANMDRILALGEAAYGIFVEGDTVIITSDLGLSTVTAVETANVSLFYDGSAANAPMEINITSAINTVDNKATYKKIDYWADGEPVFNPTVVTVDFTTDEGYFNEDNGEKNWLLDGGAYKTNAADFASSYLHTYEKNVIFKAELTYTAENDGSIGIMARVNSEHAYVKAGYDFEAGEWYIESRGGRDNFLERVASKTASVAPNTVYELILVTDGEYTTL